MDMVGLVRKQTIDHVLRRSDDVLGVLTALTTALGIPLQRPENVVARTFGGLAEAETAACLTRLANLLAEARPCSLAADFHQSQRRKSACAEPSATTLAGRSQAREYIIAMVLRAHVDEIDHDDAADVSELKLARNRIGGFHVGSIGRGFEVLRAEESSELTSIVVIASVCSMTR